MAIGSSILFGLVGGLAGAIIMAILIMSMFPKRPTPPAIMAEKMLGDADKKPIILFTAMAIWGIIYGVVISLAGYTSSIVLALEFAVIPWLVLNLIMLPMAGAGIFGSKRWNKIWIISLIEHAIWGVVLGFVYGLLNGVFT